MIKFLNNPYHFIFEGKTYECIGEDKDFQIEQFNFAIKDQQWGTVRNRILNQTLWGPSLKEIKDEK
jgi:hypothetical protein